jgi:hypothetical protein
VVFDVDGEVTFVVFDVDGEVTFVVFDVDGGVGFAHGSSAVPKNNRGPRVT